MLKSIGETSVDALFDRIPEALRLKRPLALDAGMSEPELMTHLTELSESGRLKGKVSFLGAGSYAHHLSPAVDQVLLRSEFYTAYTPYQPEVSQGTLQVIFEFQTMVCRLFGMGYANASMYDGASAAAEAALMTRRVTKARSRVLVSKGLHPEYIETIRTYLSAADNGNAKMDLVPIDTKTGATDLNALDSMITDDVSGVLIGYPNFFGVVDDLDRAQQIAHKKGAMIVSVTMDPYALGTIAAPGDLDVDIAVGEGQPIAVPVSFGGPGLGLFACREDKNFLRQMPGRLVGKTTDVRGQDGFVLTLSTREQHIRREKATSNICTNHGLCALAATVQLSLLGREGFKEASSLCLSKAEYLKKGIASIDGFSIAFEGPTFNEFAVRCRDRKAVDVLAALDVIGGVDLGCFRKEWDDMFLSAVTELHTKAHLDSFIQSLKNVGRL
jgi:glycine dehydrogenase subunit 1